MSDIKNSHIQGDLTISQNENDFGILSTNFIEETTPSSGVSILLSDLKVGKRLQFKNSGSLTTNLQLDNSNLFKIINNTGDVNILTSLNKGILISDTTGNVLINSTTDSIDENTGSLITIGGAVIGKTLTVKENINTLDGINLFTNTSSFQNVLSILNTSTSGTSSILFKNSSGTNKLEIGYGNSGLTPPLNDTSIIQSLNGSELFIRIDNQNSMKFSTNGSVDFYSNIQSSNSSSASVRFSGGISISNNTDATSSTNGGTFTTAGGMAVAKKLFIGNSLNLNNISSPAPPSPNVSSFYVDNSDNLLKSKNDSGVVTVYQPTTTKGDLVTHDGSVSVRLPVGIDGYALIADSSTSSGLKWAVGSGGVSTTNRPSSFVLNGVNVKTIVTEYPIGSYFHLVYPSVENGSSCLFFSSKTTVSINGINVRFNSNSSLTNNGLITLSYSPYKGVDLRKSYSEGEGNYIGNSNDTFVSTNITLSGTTWVNIGPSSLKDCFCFSVSSLSGGPSACFILSKNLSTQNSGNIVRLVSSPSSTSGVLIMRWNSGLSPQIQKSNINNDGQYKVVDNFQDTLYSSTITLSGTTRSTLDISLFNYYENKSLLVKVTSSISGAPYAIFTISKNSPTRSGNSTAYRSPGISSGELLRIFWDSQKTIEISKSGLNYDGSYSISFSKLV
jgi:hypothetical protein